MRGATFGSLEDGAGTALTDGSRQFSVGVRQFHKKVFRLESERLFLDVKYPITGWKGLSSTNYDFALVITIYQCMILENNKVKRTLKTSITRIADELNDDKFRFAVSAMTRPTAYAEALIRLILTKRL